MYNDLLAKEFAKVAPAADPAHITSEVTTTIQYGIFLNAPACKRLVFVGCSTLGLGLKIQNETIRSPNDSDAMIRSAIGNPICFCANSRITGKMRDPVAEPA